MTAAMTRPNIWVIIVLVVLSHCMLIWWMTTDIAPSRIPIKPTQRVVVRTVVPTTPTQRVEPLVPAPVAALAPPPIVKPQVVKQAVKSTPKPVAKQVVKSTPKPMAKPKPVATPKQEPAPAPKVIERNNVQEQRQAAAAKAKAALSQLEHKTSIPTSFVPLEIPVKAIVADTVTYADEMIARLRTQLRLPEYGDVTVMVTVDRLGQVRSHRVEKAESQVNRRYIEQMIPNCKFADFGRYFEGESEHAFTLILSNDL